VSAIRRLVTFSWSSHSAGKFGAELELGSTEPCFSFFNHQAGLNATVNTRCIFRRSYGAQGRKQTRHDLMSLWTTNYSRASDTNFLSSISVCVTETGGVNSAIFECFKRITGKKGGKQLHTLPAKKKWKRKCRKECPSIRI
jgi:hypothetical protein